MNKQIVHYDRDCLRRLLDNSLTEPLAFDVVEHVAECGECRQSLEEIAGHPQWWDHACRSVKEILAKPDAYLSDVSSGLSHTRVKGASRNEVAHAEADDSFIADFAVDFLEPSDAPAMIGRLGEYEIVEIIGRGGMGIVLKGFQKELNRFVAVKVLAPHLAMSGAARKRFAREAQATAAVVHPHVMAIHSVHANAKLPYLVMPLVPCESLQQRLNRLGPLDAKDVLRIGMQAAAGLAAAHAQGIVHRDVKPANILLETNVDRVMLTDFGLARAVDDATLTRTGIIAGTPQYMSPEQANGDPVDHRSDLFSLGSVLYTMCTGRPPFRAETTFGVLRRIRETAPRPINEINPDIPEWLERLVMRLLAKSPDDRIATAREAASLLERCLAHVQRPTMVALPEVGWALVPVAAEQAEKKTGKSAHPPTRWIVFGFIVIVVTYIGWLTRPPAPTTVAIPNSTINGSSLNSNNMRNDGDKRWPNAQRTDALPPATMPDNAILGWNATQRELDQLTKDIDNLEASQREQTPDDATPPMRPDQPDQ